MRDIGKSNVKSVSLCELNVTLCEFIMWLIVKPVAVLKLSHATAPESKNFYYHLKMIYFVT